MDIQLQELITTIKNDGVAAADRERERLIAEARTAAEAIVAEAKQSAREIVGEAEAQRLRTEAAAQATLGQTARDLMIMLKARIETLFHRVVESEVSDALTDERMTDLIVSFVESLKEEGPVVLLGEEDAKRMEASLRSRLIERVTAGIDIRPVPGIRHGFRIEVRDGAIYYDVSTKAVAEALAARLSPWLRRILLDE